MWGLSDKRIPVCCRLGNYGLSAHADRFENPRKELKVASIPSLLCLEYPGKAPEEAGG